MIQQYICPECIISDMKEKTKPGVIERLAETAARAESGLNHAKVIQVLKEREDLGSTGIGGGVAIPHGKLDGLDRMIIVVARSREGVPFDAADNRPVHVIFLLLAPNDAASQYLKTLAKISRVLRMEGVSQKILEAEDEEEIRAVIEEAEEKIRSGNF